jgi:hypothetical protein
MLARMISRNSASFLSAMAADSSALMPGAIVERDTARLRRCLPAFPMGLLGEDNHPVHVEDYGFGHLRSQTQIRKK